MPFPGCKARKASSGYAESRKCLNLNALSSTSPSPTCLGLACLPPPQGAEVVRSYSRPSLERKRWQVQRVIMGPAYLPFNPQLPRPSLIAEPHHRPTVRLQVRTKNPTRGNDSRANGALQGLLRTGLVIIGGAVGESSGVPGRIRLIVL